MTAVARADCRRIEAAEQVERKAILDAVRMLHTQTPIADVAAMLHAAAAVAQATKNEES